MGIRSNRSGGAQLEAAIFDSLSMPAALVDLGARTVLRVNGALTDWLGLKHEDLTEHQIGDVAVRLGFLWTLPPRRAEPPAFTNHEASLRLPNGSTRHVWLSATPLSLDNRICHLMTLQDVTARVEAERKVRQLKRLYATLSQVNQTILRVQNRADLYQSICEVAIRFGEFSAAWLGLWNEATDTIHPVVIRTQSGELPLEKAAEDMPLPGTARVDDPIVEALRSSKVITRSAIDAAARRLLWPAALGDPSHQAIAIIPFRLRGKTVGVVGLVSPDTEALQSAEAERLLDEMGLDVSYALDMMETQAERRQAQDEARAQALRLQILADASQAFAATEDDHSALLSEIARRVAEQLGESCGIRLISPDGITLTLAAVHSQNVEALEIVRTVQPQAPERVDGPGLIPHVARTGEPVFLPEVSIEQSRASMSAALWSRLKDLRFRSLIIVPLRAGGQILGVLLVGRHAATLGPYTQDDFRLVEDLASRASLALSNARLFQQVQNDLVERDRITEALRASEATLRLLVDHAPVALAMFDNDMRYLAVSQRWMLDYDLVGREIIGCNHYEVFPEIPDNFREAHRRGLAGEIVGSDRDPFILASGRIQWTHWEVRPWKQGDGSIGGIVLFVEDITHRMQAEEQIRYQADLLDSVSDAILSTDESFVIRSWNAAAERIYGWTADEAIGKTMAELVPTEYIGERRDEVLRHIAADGNWRGDVTQYHRDGTALHVYSAVATLQPGPGRPGGLVAVNRNITERIQAEQRVEAQLKRLRALRTIDQAIASSFDLRVTLDVLLEQVISQLNADGAVVLLLNQPLQRLEYAASRGFHSTTFRNVQIPLGQGFAGRAALDRRLVHVPNLFESGGDLARNLVLEQERFVTYFGIPLIVKGGVKGVLEVYHRRPFEPDTEWLEFLASLAGQAGIAVDNAQLFDGLQRSHHDLAIAYDATIEGWSRAMDLRDHETEGHTQTVTEVTVRLAIAAGLGNEALGHLRRGALLHDIGKLGIPDRVLFKPGPLSTEEWDLMRQHPQFAYDMLAAIPYLRPALDIPYSHHEKWDGSGYPRGLHGEHIPQAARLFAVVDVWDALRSDRPYRPAWPDDQVLEYLRAESGKHFDPQAVALFFEVLRTLD